MLNAGKLGLAAPMAVVLAFAGVSVQARLAELPKDDPNWIEQAQDDPFPAFDSLRPPVLMPENAACAISPEGNFLVEGLPRYLVGTLYYEGTDREIGLDNIGYPDALDWLYQDIPDYRGHQRLGFDSVGTFAPDRWQGKYREGKGGTPNMRYYGRWIKAGLPLVVDFTCSSWYQGTVSYKEGLPPDKKAFMPTAGQFFPWRITTAEGRRLWLDMWTDGARFMSEQGVVPMAYELFNEPGFTDDSEYARVLFAQWLKRTYKTPAGMNAALRTTYASFEEASAFERLDRPLKVDWLQYNEDLFASVCAIGAKAIREAGGHPDAGVCYQPLFLRMPGQNLYKTTRQLNRVMSHTGGGDLVEGHVLRALADGKPIMDGEMYAGGSRAGFRIPYMREFARGFNASYIFKWCKRAHDWRTAYQRERNPDGTERRNQYGHPVWVYERDADGNAVKDASGNSVRKIDFSATAALAKRCAERFGYCVLNPWAARTEWLLGIMDAKRDIADVMDLFAPRDRGVPRQVAVLYSYPSERLELGASRLFDMYVSALDYAHVPVDVLFEEQLAEGRQDRYAMIVVAGSDACYDGTLPALKRFADAGGVVVFAGGAPMLDEHGFARPGGDVFHGLSFGDELPLSESGTLSYAGESYRAVPMREVAVGGAGWKTVGRLGEAAVVQERAQGRGKLVLLNASMPEDDLGRLLAALTEREAGIRPVCSAVDLKTGDEAGRLEVVKAVQKQGEDAIVGYLIGNGGGGHRVLAFTPSDPGLVYCEIRHEDAAMPRRLLVPDGNGALALSMPENDWVVLVGAKSREVLERRYGSRLPELRYDAVVRKGLDLLAAREEAGRRNAFSVDSTRIDRVDLYPYANAGWGERDGWLLPAERTGRGGLATGNTWNRVDCNGVPMDIIRLDQNHNRTCIVLKSQSTPGAPEAVRDIAVGRKTASLFFLHAVARPGADGETAFRYVVHYADGSQETLPARIGLEVDDWSRHVESEDSRLCRLGWMDPNRRGLHLWQWRNPRPDKTVASLDIVSEDGCAVPLVVAISTERPTGRERVVQPVDLDGAALKASGIRKGATLDGGPTFLLGMRADQAFQLALEKPYRLPDGFAEASLRLELKTCKGAWRGLQVATDAASGNWTTVTGGLRTRTGSDWKQIVVPLRAFSDGTALASFALRFTGVREESEVAVCGVALLAFPEEDPFSVEAGHVMPYSWNAAMVVPSIHDDVIRFQLTEKAVSWCGCGMSFIPAVPVSWTEHDHAAEAVTFDLNTAPDLWGRHAPLSGMQLSFGATDADGARVNCNYAAIKGRGVADLDPFTWQEGVVPLRGFNMARVVEMRWLNSMNIQFQNLPTSRSGVQIRKIKFQCPEE